MQWVLGGQEAGGKVREWTPVMTKSRVWPWRRVGRDEEVQEILGLMWEQWTLMTWRMRSCGIHRVAGDASGREDGWEAVVCPQGVGLMERRVGGRVHRLCTRVRKTPKMAPCLPGVHPSESVLERGPGPWV